jgi:hypothetical protein
MGCFIFSVYAQNENKGFCYVHFSRKPTKKRAEALSITLHENFVLESDCLGVEQLAGPGEVGVFEIVGKSVPKVGGFIAADFVRF